MANKTWKASLACSAAIVALGTAGAAAAQQRTFNIPAESAIDSIPEFGRQAGVQITAPDDQLVGVKTPAIKGQRDARQALKELLAGTGLRVISDNGAVIVLHRGGEGTSPPAEAGAAAAASQVSELVVTGTHIRNADPLSPLTVLRGATLEEQGYTRLDQAIQQLPQEFGGAVVPTSNGFTGAGVNATLNGTFASGVNLRGLGIGTTLVLLNGERPALSSVGTSFDISSIPLSAIDRVEILTDGASATYGSDAIGGVVNIIMKPKFDGLETGARVTSISDGKDPNYGGYILGGKSWSTGNIIINYNYENDRPLLASSRAFSAAVPAPSDLLPSGETNSLYGSVRQEISSNLTMSADVLATHRTFAFTQNEAIFGGGQVGGNGNTTNVQVSTQIDYRLPFGWHAELFGAYGYDRDYTAYTSFFVTQPQTFSYSVPSGGLRLDGPILDLPGGTVRSAFGVEVRHEQFTALNGSESGSGARTVASTYGELLLPLVGKANSVPLIEALEIDLSGRYDHYSDFGSTTNPKLAAKWTLSPDLALHASYGRSFRAPTFQQGFGPTVGYVINLNNPSAPSGTGTALLLDALANTHLQPERSSSFNTGLTLTPRFVPSLKVTVDYFDISYTNQIVNLVQEGFFQEVFTESNELGSFVNLSPTAGQINTAIATVTPGFLVVIPPASAAGISAIANLGTVNAAASKVQGLDFDVKYDWQGKYGSIALDWATTLFTEYQQKITLTAPAASILDTPYNPIALKSKLNIAWTYNGVSVDGRINYVNSYHNPADLSCPSRLGCGVSAWTTVDLSVSYAFSRTSSVIWAKGIRVGLDVTNIFNRPPPVVNTGNQLLSYDPVNADPLGRAFALSIVKRW